MKKVILLSLLICSCAPVQKEPEYKTKYPDVPTMQSAEDASHPERLKF